MESFCFVYEYIEFVIALDTSTRADTHIRTHACTNEYAGDKVALISAQFRDVCDVFLTLSAWPFCN